MRKSCLFPCGFIVFSGVRKPFEVSILPNCKEVADPARNKQETKRHPQNWSISAFNLSWDGCSHHSLAHQNRKGNSASPLPIEELSTSPEKVPE